MALAAEAGTDMGALHVWAADNLDGSDLTDKDPALAYRYFTALQLICLDLMGPDNPASKVFGDMGKQLSGDLDQAQRAAELAAAQRIAANARAARKQGRGD